MTVTPLSVMIEWDNPTTNTDGSPLAQSDIAGYEIQLDATPAVSVPTGYATKFDLATLAGFSALKSGTHTADLAVVNQEGQTSAFTGPVSFPILPKVPSMATNLRMA